MAMLVSFSHLSCKLTSKPNIVYNYNIDKNIDYNDLTKWAAHPQIKDNSDSISSVFGGSINLDLCDIFYLHPTSFTDSKLDMIPNASLEDSITNNKTDATAILYQASVFNEVGRIYAPRYRQAHIQKYFDSGDVQKSAFDMAYADIKKAFSTYLDKWNEGRPIVIAAHSQGTTHALRLIHELIDNHELSNRIVFAYLLGMPVRKREFISIKPCNNDTNNYCFVSWRTYRKGYKGTYEDKLDTMIAVTNPVDIYAASRWSGIEKKKRAILWNYNVGQEKTHDTRVMGNMLWITRPRFKGGLLGLLMKNYHAGDINLFYEDIRTDIKQRIVRNLVIE